MQLERIIVWKALEPPALPEDGFSVSVGIPEESETDQILLDFEASEIGQILLEIMEIERRLGIS